MKKDKKSKNIDGLRALKQKKAQLMRTITSLTSDLTAIDGAIQVFKGPYIRDDFVIINPTVKFLPKPTEAVKHLLSKNPKSWSFSEIIAELEKTGVNSKAKNLASPVSTALRSLKKGGFISVTGKNRNQLYKWEK